MQWILYLVKNIFLEHEDVALGRWRSFALLFYFSEKDTLLFELHVQLIDVDVLAVSQLKF